MRCEVGVLLTKKEGFQVHHVSNDLIDACRFVLWNILRNRRPICTSKCWHGAFNHPKGDSKPLGDSAQNALRMVAANMNLTPQQKEELRLAWLEYCEAANRFQFRLKQFATSSGIEASLLDKDQNAQINDVVEKPEDAAASISISSYAQRMLALRRSTSNVSDAPQSLAIAYGKLAKAVVFSLTAIQKAKLFVGTRPYQPDHVQLCRLIFGLDK